MSAAEDPLRRLASERGRALGELGMRPEDDRWTSGAAHHYAELSAWYRENLKETD